MMTDTAKVILSIYFILNIPLVPVLMSAADDIAPKYKHLPWTLRFRAAIPFIALFFGVLLVLLSGVVHAADAYLAWVRKPYGDDRG